MTRFLVTAAALLVVLGAVSGASAAERKGSSGHHYFWIETPPAQPDRACEARDLWTLINRGDLCPANDAPAVPPLYTP